MLYNKRPLIYIPKKKKIVQGSAPTPTPEVLGSVWLSTQYLNYNPTIDEDGRRPSRISVNPEKWSYRGDTFDIYGKNDYKYTTTTDVYIVPICSDSSATCPNRAASMRWAPLQTSRLTGVSHIAVPYIFYIPKNGTTSATQFPTVYKFKDSTKTGNQYRFEQTTNEEVLCPDPYRSSANFYLRKFDSSKLNDIQRVYDKVVNLSIGGTPGYGLFVATNKDFSIWTDPVLLQYANVVLRESYGRKTAVVEIDLGV